MDFTLTYPGCPIGPELKEEIEQVLKDATGIDDVDATLVWEPRWGPERMTEEARLEPGLPDMREVANMRTWRSEDLKAGDRGKTDPAGHRPGRSGPARSTR